MLHDLMEKLMGQIQAGGDTMIPLLIVSVVMWTLAVYKFRSFAGERGRDLGRDELSRMMRDCDADIPEDLARWQQEIIWEYRMFHCSDSGLNRDILEALRIRLDAGVSRHVRTILILAAVAPLLGLLGTVTGMIYTFDVISIFGTGNARALAGGISEALITTQSGLVIAVPGMIVGGLLYRSAEKIRARMELFCINIQCAAEAVTGGGD